MLLSGFAHMKLGLLIKDNIAPIFITEGNPVVGAVMEQDSLQDTQSIQQLLLLSILQQLRQFL